MEMKDTVAPESRVISKKWPLNLTESRALGMGVMVLRETVGYESVVFIWQQEVFGASLRNRLIAPHFTAEPTVSQEDPAGSSPWDWSPWSL